MNRVLAVAVAAAGIAMTSAPAHAGDLFGIGAPVDVGEGWYLRGDVGYGLANTPTIVPQQGLIPQLLTDATTGDLYVNQPIGDASNPVAATRGNNVTSSYLSLNAGFGYRFNEHFRMDATYSYWSGAAYSYKQSTLCPGVATQVTNMELVSGVATAVPVGYAWTPNLCNGIVNATQYNQTTLANAYFDIAHIGGFVPYVGAGLGVNVNTVNGASQFFNQNDGSNFAGNTSATGTAPLLWVVPTAPTLAQSALGNSVWYTPLGTQPNVTFGPQNWNRSINQTKYSIAWSAMVGFSYALSTDLMLDVGYRYLSAPINAVTNNLQEVKVGIRLLAQ